MAQREAIHRSKDNITMNLPKKRGLDRGQCLTHVRLWLPPYAGNSLPNGAPVSRDCAICTATKLRTRRPRNLCSIPEFRRDFCLRDSVLEGPSGPPSLLHEGYRMCISGRGVNLTTHLRLILRISAITLLPPFAFMACTGTLLLLLRWHYTPMRISASLTL
jgi:hypothetical protein